MRRQLRLLLAGCIPRLVAPAVVGCRRRASRSLESRPSTLFCTLICVSDDAEEAIANAGAIPRLVALLSSPSREVQRVVASALRAFRHEQRKSTIAEIGALLASPSVDAQAAAASALGQLGQTTESAALIAAGGGAIPRLVTMLAPPEVEMHVAVARNLVAEQK